MFKFFFEMILVVKIMRDHEYEVRDPIHGMIPFSSLERDFMNCEAFQRLRRIRQLSWTDYVYPGAMHTRFQHTLGVMHTASRIFDAIVSDPYSKELLKSEFALSEGIVERQRIIIRLAALVHDLGHTPFSHAGEGLMPQREGKAAISGEKPLLYTHEEYSVEIFKKIIFPQICSHKEISSHNIGAEEITGLVDGTPANAFGALCKDIISGRIDADRMDYLLRDSYYCGVRYGHYEIDRLINTICVLEDPEDEGSYSIGIKSDGLHAAEGLLIARYMMFHNVYFHKTRVIFDYHYQEALSHMLKGRFPKPTDAGIQKYLSWDDWKVLGRLQAGKAGEHGEFLSTRKHYQLVYQTNESHEDEAATRQAFERFAQAQKLAEKVPHYVWSERKSFAGDILVMVRDSGKPYTKPLLELSGVVKSLRPLNQKRLYVDRSHSMSIKSNVENLAA